MRNLYWNEKNERTFYLEALMNNWKGRMFKPCYVNRCTHKKYKRYLNLDVSLFVEKCGKSTNFFVVRPVRSFPVTRDGLLKHPYYVDNWGEQTFAKSKKWRAMESSSEVTLGNIAKAASLTLNNDDFRMAIFYQPTPSHERELALGCRYVK